MVEDLDPTARKVARDCLRDAVGLKEGALVVAIVQRGYAHGSA